MNEQTKAADALIASLANMATLRDADPAKEKAFALCLDQAVRAGALDLRIQGRSALGWALYFGLPGYACEIYGAGARLEECTNPRAHYTVLPPASDWAQAFGLRRRAVGSSNPYDKPDRADAWQSFFCAAGSRLSQAAHAEAVARSLPRHILEACEKGLLASACQCAAPQRAHSL